MNIGTIEKNFDARFVICSLYISQSGNLITLFLERMFVNFFWTVNWCILKERMTFMHVFQCNKLNTLLGMIYMLHKKGN